MATAFFETYERLCAQRGMSDNAVAAKIGLSNSTVTSWKQGALPRRPTVKKVADYFGVTTDYLLNGGLSMTSQTHLASGVHIFKSVTPLGLDDSITENLTPDSFDIVYRDSTSLIVVDKGSNVPKSQLNEIIRTYSSHGKEEAPAPEGERIKKAKRSIARLEDADITEEEDAQIDELIAWYFKTKGKDV